MDEMCAVDFSVLAGRVESEKHPRLRFLSDKSDKYFFMCTEEYCIETFKFTVHSGRYVDILVVDNFARDTHDYSTREAISKDGSWHRNHFFHLPYLRLKRVHVEVMPQT